MNIMSESAIIQIIIVMALSLAFFFVIYIFTAMFLLSCILSVILFFFYVLLIIFVVNKDTEFTPAGIDKRNKKGTNEIRLKESGKLKTLPYIEKPNSENS